MHSTWGRALALVGGAVALAAGSTPAGATTNWPATISTAKGFNDLGKAIRESPGFPKAGTDVEKAQFVFNRLPDIAKKYGLKPGSGKVFSNLVIGLYRFKGDPEGADALKGITGWGNCGEWTYAFSEVLDGAGVLSQVIFGDKSGESGEFSSTFTGTDTTLYVEQLMRDGRTSRRVFDAFRAVYHGKDYVPTPDTLRDWGNVPLMDTDKLNRDQGVSWQKNVAKPYVKEATSMTVLPPKPRRAPPMADLSGWWTGRLANGHAFPVRISAVGDEGKFDGVMYYQGYPATTSPGRFRGTLREKQLYYTWSNSEPSGGEGELRFDGKSLSGHWKDLQKSPGTTGRWSLTRMAAPPKGAR